MPIPARRRVESTINLAHALGMHVIAEGVETTPVRDRLSGLGCERRGCTGEHTCAEAAQ